jgi:hypothetical protein
MGKYTPHKLKLAVGRDKANGTSCVEIVQPHALMKLTIVQLDSVTRTRTILVYHEFVVQAKLALWRTRQISPHLNMAIHVGA